MCQELTNLMNPIHHLTVLPAVRKMRHPLTPIVCAVSAPFEPEMGSNASHVEHGFTLVVCPKIRLESVQFVAD